jgi:predicted RNA-binding Zn-ribbon protein involved in translation (DUF1610 family)
VTENNDAEFINALSRIKLSIVRNTMQRKTKVPCPKCGEEARQFEVPEEYRTRYGSRGKHYCDRCGWLEDHDQPIPSLIREKAEEKQLIGIIPQESLVIAQSQSQNNRRRHSANDFSKRKKGSRESGSL